MGSESSEGSWVLSDIETSLLLEVSHAEIDKLVIEIFSTKMGMSVGSLNFEDTFLNGEEGDIESTTSEIEDEDVLLLSGLFIKTVGNSGGGWLVNDSKNVNTRDGSGILGGLSLGIVEISWDSDDSRFNFFTEISFSDFLHLDEDHG
mgnify:CR=1 FL=1